MKFLFIHQNFPGQFKHLASALAANPSNTVLALTVRARPGQELPGVRLVRYAIAKNSTPGVHPWAADIETKVIRGEACFRAARQLREQGFCPDAIIAHPGWGESLFLKEVWPAAKLGLYCEFFYHPAGADVGFDPEFPAEDPGDACRVRLKNLNNLFHLPMTDAAISPTRWQASTFPETFRDRITVVHDGIDTDLAAPNPGAGLRIGSELALTRGDEIVTFVSRNLEPYRGFHIFMRALPELLRRRPQARILIVGGNDASYGRPPTKNQSWMDIFINEAKPRIAQEDWKRVHFIGKLPYNLYLAVLQLSAVHVYLTYPFVLSWSLLEAMSVGCAIVASDTTPLHEAIRHDETGRLVPFFDVQGLTDQVCSLLDDPASRNRLGSQARAFARLEYDLKRICLPRQLQWIDTLLRS